MWVQNLFYFLHIVYVKEWFYIFLYEYTIVPSPFDEGIDIGNECQIKSRMTGETRSMYYPKLLILFCQYCSDLYLLQLQTFQKEKLRTHNKKEGEKESTHRREH